MMKRQSQDRTCRSLGFHIFENPHSCKTPFPAWLVLSLQCRNTLRLQKLRWAVRNDELRGVNFQSHMANLRMKGNDLNLRQTHFWFACVIMVVPELKVNSKPKDKEELELLTPCNLCCYPTSCLGGDHQELRARCASAQLCFHNIGFLLRTGKARLVTNCCMMSNIMYCNCSVVPAKFPGLLAM